MTDPDRGMLIETLRTLRRRLLDARAAENHWRGELSSSALSTATAAFALALFDHQANEDRIERGLRWLIAHQNDDGGWGDTPDSPSNISTTMLSWAALPAAQAAPDADHAAARAERWLARACAGSPTPQRLARTLTGRYGQDRTFSVPILTMCALAGRLGPTGPRGQAWRLVPQLPFELAACPHGMLKFLRLPVVSYALPALIAIGQARHHFLPTANPLTRALRNALAGRTLRLLESIQPTSGGFLEAAPLTAFVAMCLSATGRGDGAVTRGAARFLIDTQRADGSWPIDTDLAVWVTSLASNALSAGTGVGPDLAEFERRGIGDWLLDRQYRTEHPYTRAAPGGWAWTDLSGGVPDADDTAGALLAIRRLGLADERAQSAAAAGARWLLDLQNRDGGVPTFCRGWGRLPFDRSGADLTAHTLAAWSAWADLPRVRRSAGRGLGGVIARAVGFLARAQRQEGAWLPLWFGNQFAPDQQNPTYGTARVVTALSGQLAGGRRNSADPLARRVEAMLEAGGRWLIAAQARDGGWGPAPGRPASIEETAVAVEALARLLQVPNSYGPSNPLRAAVVAGARWLIERTDRGRSTEPAPIGLYFARLWYAERLYPLIFSAAALGAASDAGVFGG